MGRGGCALGSGRLDLQVELVSADKEVLDVLAVPELFNDGGNVLIELVGRQKLVHLGLREVSRWSGARSLELS